MSDPVTILGTIAVGFAVSYITEEITGSETLGMIAGLAAGGWAGSAIAGYQAAGVAAPAAASAAQSGSALGVAGSAPLGGAAVSGAVPTSQITAQAAGGVASQLPGAAPAAASVAPAASSSFFGFSPDEMLKVAAGGLSGMAEYRQKEKEREVNEDYQRLLEERDEEEKRRYYAQSAYGVTRAGDVVPINAGQQLQDMNQRLAYMPHTSTGTTMSNINTIQRPEGGYVSGFGRHQKESQNA